MKRHSRLVMASMAAIGTAAMALSGTTSAEALSTTSPTALSPFIVGGSRAPSTPWAVQLIGTSSEGQFGCTGEQLNSAWVLTARHCIEDAEAMDIYHSNSTANPGQPSTADSVEAAPQGDIALVHLGTPYALPSYAPVRLDYTASRTTGTGKIMGYGLRANQGNADSLYQASVRLSGASEDAFGGSAQHLLGESGTANHGDSGGPLLINGVIVGVCSTGDSNDPGSNTHAGSNYSLIAQSGSWLATTAGLD